MGNITYGAGVSPCIEDALPAPLANFLQILFHSTEKQYFLTNLPWLIGSLGTIAEDAIIFVQFHMYGEHQSAIED